MKKIISILLIVSVAICMLAGCKKGVGSPEDNAAAVLEEKDKDKPEEEEKIEFGFSGISMENPYYIILEKSIRNCVESAGYTMVTENPGNDSAVQSRQLLNMMEDGVDVIFLTPVDMDKISPTLRLLDSAGIKVINVDSQVRDLSLVDAFIGSDNYKAGELCAKSLIEKKPDGANIVILESDMQYSVVERISGFESTLSDSDIPFEIVQRADTKGDFNEALKKITDILNERNDVDVIMCGNDQIAVASLAAVNVVKASDPDRGNIIIYSVDGSPDIKKELQKQNSMIAGTVAQAPIHIGNKAFDIAMAIIDGEEYEKSTVEDVSMIDAENLSMYGVDGWQ